MLVKRTKRLGRKPLPDTEELRKRVDELASIGMKTRDIAILTGMAEKAVERRFASSLSKRRVERRAELLRKQWDVGLKGDKTLLIWLGKNYGEQSDRADVTSGGEPLKVIVERIG